MKPPIVKAILLTSRTYADGTHPIMIRITKDRKRMYKSIGYSVLPENWDFENDCCYEKKPSITKRQEGLLNSEKLNVLKSRYSNSVTLSNASHLNSLIKSAIDDIFNIHQKMKVENIPVQVETIKEAIENSLVTTKRVSLNLIDYGRCHIDKLIRMGSIGTSKRYKVVIEQFSNFTKSKGIDLKKIDLKFLHEYEIYLNSLGYKINTTHNHLKTIRALYYMSIKEGLLQPISNPFLHFKMKVDNNTHKARLGIEEIQCIEKLDLEPNSLLWHVKNTFLFSFYCAGIRIGDLIQLKWGNLNAEDRIEYKMDKTGGYKSIQLIPKAKAIIDCYRVNRVKSSDHIFPFYRLNDEASAKAVFNEISSKTSLINKYLKQIATLAKIKKPLSTHIARHSFSDIARKRGANVFDISKMLGHSSIKITESYLQKLDKDSMDKTLREVLDF